MASKTSIQLSKFTISSLEELPEELFTQKIFLCLDWMDYYALNFVSNFFQRKLNLTKKLFHDVRTGKYTPTEKHIHHFGHSITKTLSQMTGLSRLSLSPKYGRTYTLDLNTMVNAVDFYRSLTYYVWFTVTFNIPLLQTLDHYKQRITNSKIDDLKEQSEQWNIIFQSINNNRNAIFFFKDCLNSSYLNVHQDEWLFCLVEKWFFLIQTQKLHWAFVDFLNFSLDIGVSSEKFQNMFKTLVSNLSIKLLPEAFKNPQSPNKEILIGCILNGISIPLSTYARYMVHSLNFGNIDLYEILVFIGCPVYKHTYISLYFRNSSCSMGYEMFEKIWYKFLKKDRKIIAAKYPGLSKFEKMLESQNHIKKTFLLEVLLHASTVLEYRDNVQYFYSVSPTETTRELDEQNEIDLPLHFSKFYFIEILSSKIYREQLNTHFYLFVFKHLSDETILDCRKELFEIMFPSNRVSDPVQYGYLSMQAIVDYNGDGKCLRSDIVSHFLGVCARNKYPLDIEDVNLITFTSISQPSEKMIGMILQSHTLIYSWISIINILCDYHIGFTSSQIEGIEKIFLRIVFDQFTHQKPSMDDLCREYFKLHILLTKGLPVRKELELDE